MKSAFDFELNDTQQSLVASVRRFAGTELAPRARHFEEKGTIPLETYRLLAELGLLGICVSEANGGAGLSLLDLCLAVQELARADAALAVSVANHNLVAFAIERYGAAAFQTEFLAGLVNAELLGVLWHSHAAPNQTPSETFAVLPPGPQLHLFESNDETYNLFKKEVLSFTRHLSLGLCSLPFASLTIGSLPAPDGILSTNGGLLRHHSLILRAAAALGIGETSLEVAIRYARERRQFGRAICDFQAIQWKLADSATELAAASLLCRRAALSNKPADAAMACLNALSAAQKASDEAVQIHGGYGFSREFLPERLYRDSRVVAADFGTTDFLRTGVATQILASLS